MRTSVATEPSGPGVWPRRIAEVIRSPNSPTVRSAIHSSTSSRRVTGSCARPRVRASSISSSAFGVSSIARTAPSETRSFANMVVAARQPSFTRPTTFAAGIRTPSRKISLKCASPFIWWIGRISAPGELRSSTNIVMPRCLGTSGSVRAMSSPKSQSCAPDVQIFCPVTT